MISTAYACHPYCQRLSMRGFEDLALLVGGLIVVAVIVYLVERFRG